MSKKLRHRGPDWSGIYTGSKAIMTHERLAIVDPISGKQPLYSNDGKIALTINGDIFNHEELRKQFPDYPFKTKSDCEIILPLYQKKGIDFLEDLNGCFAFALYDEEKDAFLIARDHIGANPLYYGMDNDGQLYFASELKALEGHCYSIKTFPPGHYIYSPEGLEPKKWYSRDWEDYENVKNNKTDLTELREALEKAVKDNLMTDVPFGLLLSGGLDSSVIAAIAKKYSDKRVETGGKESAWYPQIHSFAIGLEGSPDIKAAKIAADFIGTVHHEVKFTVQEGLDALSDVIYHLETYDVTSVRASTPMFLMARVIKSMGIKMVLSGEGSDEIFGGYLYFHKAPNAEEFHNETVRKLSQLYLYDNLRANKAMAAWGVEARTPFLDKEFMDVAMRINPEDKMAKDGKMEKWVVRKAFEGYLPDEVLWRQKEQFSDGVGYNWIDTLKRIVDEKITDQQLAEAALRFPVNPPMNKEEYYYRTIFEEHFPSNTSALTVPHAKSVACSTPQALLWDASFQNMNDPSGRAVASVHKEAYK